MPKKKENTNDKIDIKIRAHGEFGSEFQRKYAEQMLTLMVQTWVLQVNGRHRKTHLDLAIHGVKYVKI